MFNYSNLNTSGCVIPDNDAELWAKQLQINEDIAKSMKELRQQICEVNGLFDDEDEQVCETDRSIDEEE